jgi:hypothetical protein
MGWMFLAFGQVPHTYSYHYAYRPAARVYFEGSTYYLEVDGMEQMVEVRKVR